MRHGTRQLYGKRARHGAGHRHLAWFYAAEWPGFAPPLTHVLSFSELAPFQTLLGAVVMVMR